MINTTPDQRRIFYYNNHVLIVSCCSCSGRVMFIVFGYFSAATQIYLFIYLFSLFCFEYCAAEVHNFGTF